MAQHSDEVDRLLRTIMPHAPEVLHHVFALEGKSSRSSMSQACLTKSLGANEVLLGLNTVESKAAYLVQIIAVELYKASKAISSKVRCRLMSLQPELNRTAEHIFWSE